VSFSGGRDSSAILALAAHVARRDGLPLPIAATYRFPGVPDAEESSWQELMMRRLELSDWIRLEAVEEFDLLGPEARAVLERHGVMVPFTAYCQAPRLFGGWRWRRVASFAAGRERPGPRDLLTIAFAAAPGRVRKARELRDTGLQPAPWLRPDVERAIDEAWVEGRALEPRRWNRRVAWYARRRGVLLPCFNTAVLAEDAGATITHPLLAPRFLAAMARAGGRWGGGTRTEWMRSLFGDVLPEQVLGRRDKADLAGAFWGEQTRAFIEEWDGSGLDENVVNVDALRAAWRERAWLSVSLMHLAWLHSRHPARLASSA
jgi:hypothetical protein